MARCGWCWNEASTTTDSDPCIFCGRVYPWSRRGLRPHIPAEDVDIVSAGGGGVTVDNTVDAPFSASTIIAAGATETAPDEATLAAFPLQTFSATVELTDAQIKALSATPVTVVAAPGANKVIVPLFGVASIHIVTGYNAESADAAFRLVYPAGSNASGLFSSNLAAAADTFGKFAAPYALADATFDNEVYTAGTSEGSAANRALSIKEDWVNAPFTGGNAANTITVTVVYVVVDV